MFQRHDSSASWRTAVKAGGRAGGGLDSALEVLYPEDLLEVGLGSDILIVDDAASNLVAYEAALAPLGRQVVSAQSGLAALAKLLAQDFALVLLDVSMPEMTGIETARAIRQRARNRSLPIIFITGAESSPELLLEAYEAGAFDFIVKPILPEILRAKAGVYLQLQERTQALLRYSKQLREAHRLLDEADEKLRDREAAAATAHRLQKLQDATAALAQASTPAEVARVAVQLGADAANAASACLWVDRPDGSLVLEASHGVPEAYLAPWSQIAPGAELPIARVLRARRTLWVETAADYEREAPEQLARARAADRVWAFAALPLVSHDRGIGVLAFGFPGDHVFADEERRFLTAFGRACEQALDRSRLYEAEGLARRAAEEANQRKDEFLAMLSHELRNPLWALVNALELAKAAPPRPGRELDIIESQVEHLRHIVDSLLDVGRSTRGKIRLAREPVELAATVASLLDGLRRSVAQRDHHVTVTTPDDLWLDADRHRLRQVLENLLINAIEYTPDRGRIEILAEPEDDTVRITVRDHGRGIPADLLPRLFELFVQGEQTLARSEGGLGVGLTLARTLVELHGGTIEAHSAGPDTGATFVVRWPRSPAGLPARHPTTAPAASGARRILIVDDNADAADMLGTLLQSLGHDVAIAFDGPSALELARRFVPDVGLLDIGLPGMDGYELARRLRLEDACRHTLLVAITGYSQPSDRLRSKAAGFAYHFVKPVELSSLMMFLATRGGDRAS